MLPDLDRQARQLADYMSELSEKAYAAGWMKELEYELWVAVVGGPREYGRLQVSAEHIAQLRKLSQAASGWIVFDDENEETHLPIAEWEQRFAYWKQNRGG